MRLRLTFWNKSGWIGVSMGAQRLLLRSLCHLRAFSEAARNSMIKALNWGRPSRENQTWLMSKPLAMTCRLVNRRILLSILSDRQPISRSEIAKISGLNKATISTITGELLKDRCIIEQGSGRTTPIGGKPPTPLRLNALRFGLLGLDIRAEETILALSDFNNRLVARLSFETPNDAGTFLSKIGKEIAKLRAKHDDFIEFAGIGVSLPGLVDSHRGEFLISVVLPWRDVPVVQLLEKATGSRLS